MRYIPSVALIMFSLFISHLGWGTFAPIAHAQQSTESSKKANEFCAKKLKEYKAQKKFGDTRIERVRCRDDESKANVTILGLCTQEGKCKADRTCEKDKPCTPIDKSRLTTQTPEQINKTLQDLFRARNALPFPDPDTPDPPDIAQQRSDLQQQLSEAFGKAEEKKLEGLNANQIQIRSLEDELQALGMDPFATPEEKRDEQLQVGHLTQQIDALKAAEIKLEPTPTTKPGSGRGLLDDVPDTPGIHKVIPKKPGGLLDDIPESPGIQTVPGKRSENQNTFPIWNSNAVLYEPQTFFQLQTFFQNVMHYFGSWLPNWF